MVGQASFLAWASPGQPGPGKASRGLPGLAQAGHCFARDVIMHIMPKKHLLPVLKTFFLFCILKDFCLKI